MKNREDILEELLEKANHMKYMQSFETDVYPEKGNDFELGKFAGFCKMVDLIKSYAKK